VEELQKLLLTPRFAHLTAEAHKKLHNGLANQDLFAGIMGKNVVDILLRINAADFDHLTAENKADFAHKFKNMYFLRTCTRIECEQYGATARTDAEKELYGRAVQKYANMRLRDGDESNPHLPTLTVAWLVVRSLFAAMCLRSTKDDDKWHSVDLDTVKAD